MAVVRCCTSLLSRLERARAPAHTPLTIFLVRPIAAALTSAHPGSRSSTAIIGSERLEDAAAPHAGAAGATSTGFPRGDGADAEADEPVRRTTALGGRLAGVKVVLGRSGQAFSVPSFVRSPAAAVGGGGGSSRSVGAEHRAGKAARILPSRGFHASARGKSGAGWPAGGTTLTHTLSADADAKRIAATLAQLRTAEAAEAGSLQGGGGSGGIGRKRRPDDLIDAESRRRWRRAEWVPQQPLPGQDDPWEFYLGAPDKAAEMRARHIANRSVPGDGHSGAVTDPAVLIIAYNRPRYLLETLRSLAQQRQLSKFKVYLSQDGALGQPQFSIVLSVRRS